MTANKKQILNVLRVKQASEYLAISETTFWRWVKEGRLPKGKHIGARITVWEVKELDNFLSKFDETEQA